MKHVIFTIMTIAILFCIGSMFILGCSDSKSGQGEVTTKDVKNETREAIETATAYTREQKDAYVRKLENGLEQVDERIQSLAEKARTKSGQIKNETKEQFNQEMDVLRRKKEVVAEKLNDLKSASGDAWAEIKASVDQAYSDLKTGIDMAGSHFTK